MVIPIASILIFKTPVIQTKDVQAFSRLTKHWIGVALHVLLCSLANLGRRNVGAIFGCNQGLAHHEAVCVSVSAASTFNTSTFKKSQENEVFLSVAARCTTDKLP